MKLKVKILNLLAQGNIDKVIFLILKLKLNSNIKDEVVIISARWERLKKENRLETIPKNSFDQESNKILVALQELVNQSDFFIKKLPPWPIFVTIFGLSMFVVLLLLFISLRISNTGNKSLIAPSKIEPGKDSSNNYFSKATNKSKNPISYRSDTFQKDSFEIEGVVIDSLGNGIEGLEIWVENKCYAKSQTNGNFKFYLISNDREGYRMYIRKRDSILTYRHFQVGDDLKISL